MARDVSHRRFNASITQKGQLTIPSAVRRALNLKGGDAVVFSIEGQQAVMEPMEYTIDTVFGSVTPIHRPEDFKALTGRAWEERAATIVGKLKTD